jgi:chromosome segregation protein
MSVDKPEAAEEVRLQWLDEELRAAKAALHKVEHELEQALNQIWNLDSGLRKLEETSGDAGAAATAMPALHEEVRQLRSVVGKMQDRQNLLAGKLEETLRQQQADMGRERQERALVIKQADAGVRAISQFEARIQRLEDSLRHLDEALSETRLARETMARDLEEIGNRTSRNLETALRLEQQVSGFNSEAEELRKRDGELDERINLLEERLRRQEERLDKHEDNLKLPLEMKEQLDRAVFERQQLSERLGKVEAVSGSLVERTADFIQGLALVEQRAQAQAGRLLEMTEELKEQRDVLFEQMRKLIRTMERQRRRQAEGLAQEIKELSRSDPTAEQ